MNEFTFERVGWLVFAVGVADILAVLSLLLFFIGLFQSIDTFSLMGNFNDTMNVIVGILSAVLASQLHVRGRNWVEPRVSLFLLILVWVGAIFMGIGSWLIQTGRADVELSSYYYFFGNGLIGIWLWVLNRAVRHQSILPRKLTILGSIASVFMMLGLLSLPGILLGLDGDEYSPLIMASGISFLGTGILYSLWCLWLARWALSDQTKRQSRA